MRERFLVRDWSTLVLLAIVCACLLLSCYGIALAATNEVVKPLCLSAGYPTATVTYDLRAFCVKRVDQTDVVVPLGEVGSR